MQRSRSGVEAGGLMFSWMERVGEQLGRGLVGRGATVPSAQVTTAKPKRAARRAPAAPKASQHAAKAELEVGGVVHYRQGRGGFKAKVVAVDAEAGMVVLERVVDGKRVERRIGVVSR